MIVPPAGYLREAQRLCRRYGALLVVDEVQTGLGRTGTLFASDAAEVEPDIMTLAKSLGGGLVPIGAMLARRDLWMKAYGDIHSFAMHTSTFGGGSLACAAGLATLDVLQRDNVIQNAAARGRQIREGLERLCRRYEMLREVRGQGLLLGLDFAPASPTIIAHWKAADGRKSTSFMVPNLDAMLQSGPALYAMQFLLQMHNIYTQVTRSNPHVLRVQPPLIVSAEQVRRFLDALDQCCDQIDSSMRMFDGIVVKSSLGQR
jgi:putrescine aminotransferase